MMHEGIVECSGLGLLHILDVADQHTQALVVAERVLGQLATAPPARNPSDTWIEVSGLRISYVMLAWYFVLAWLVASAWRLANCSS